MTAFITGLTTIATAFFGWFGDVVTMIMDNPILLFISSIAIVSSVFGIVLRFINVNG